MRIKGFLKWTAIFLTVALPVSCFAAREYYGRPISRDCFEFSVAFSAEGRDYVLRTPIAEEVYRGPAIAYGGVTIVTYPKVAAQRLPSGAGVFFNVPFHEKFSLPDELIQSPSSPDRLPYSFWLDDARNPSKMEAYFSDNAQKAPRVKVEALSFRDIPTCSPTKPGDEIPWFNRPRKERFLYGHYAHAIPEEEWSTYPAVVEAVQHMETFARLPDEAAAQVRALTPGVPRYGGDSSTIRVAGRGEPIRRIMHGAVDGLVRPIVREGSDLRLLTEVEGEAVYYPERFEGWITLRIGDRAEEVRASKWYYDPAGRYLLKVVSVTF